MGAFDALRVGQIDSGYWGNHTSSIDWCEYNYTHSRFIAEFANTLSNFPSILLGLYGAAATYSAGIPRRYALAYLGLSFIGIGSTGFHMTLRWDWQLMDELPMIYVASYVAYLSFDTHPTFKPRWGLWGPLALVAFDTFVTLSYIYMPNPIYHEIAFALLMFTCVGRTTYAIFCLPKGNHWSRPAVKRTFGWGVATFAAAFGIWNIDNLYCNQLRAAREYLGVWGFLLQGHAYWHFGTGYGSFLIFTAGLYMQLAMKVSPNAYRFNSDEWFPLTRPVMPSHTQPSSPESEDAPRDTKTQQ